MPGFSWILDTESVYIPIIHEIPDKRRGEADRLFFPARWAWLPVVHFFRFERSVSMLEGGLLASRARSGGRFLGGSFHLLVEWAGSSVGMNAALAWQRSGVQIPPSPPFKVY